MLSLIPFIILIFVSLSTRVHPADVAKGLDTIKTIRSQQDLRTIPCTLRIAEKYFQFKQALAGSIVVINIPPVNFLYTNLLIKRFVTASDYKTNIIVRYAHRNDTHVIGGKIAAHYKIANYFMLVNSTSEIAPTLR